MRPARAHAALAAWFSLAAAVACADEDPLERKPPAPPVGAVSDAQQWLARAAIPLRTVEPRNGFEDLEPWRAIIGNAQVIAFGEGMHDTHEFLALRNRLFEFLVSEMGVTAIGLETGVTEAMHSDDYVLGIGSPSDETFNGVFSWAPTPSLESQQLLEWMRQWNARPTTKRPVRIYGLDLTGGRSGVFTHARLAIEGALSYVEQMDADLGRRLRRTLQPQLANFEDTRYWKQSASARNTVSAALVEMRGWYENRSLQWRARSTPRAFEQGYRNLIVAEQLDANFRISGNDEVKMELRDSSMALNLLRVLEQEGPGARMMVFAHNVHLRNAPAETGFDSLGQYLKAALGERLVTIGSVYGRGSVGEVGGEIFPLEPAHENTLNAVMVRSAAAPRFIVDLRTAPRSDPFLTWMREGRPLEKFYFEGNPLASFDALVFIDTISPLNALRR